MALPAFIQSKAEVFKISPRVTELGNIEGRLLVYKHVIDGISSILKGDLRKLKIKTINLIVKDSVDLLNDVEDVQANLRLTEEFISSGKISSIDGLQQHLENSKFDLFRASDIFALKAKRNELTIEDFSFATDKVYKYLKASKKNLKLATQMIHLEK